MSAFCFMRGMYIRERIKGVERAKALWEALCKYEVFLNSPSYNTGWISIICLQIGKSFSPPFRLRSCIVADVWSLSEKGEGAGALPHQSCASADIGKKPPLFSNKGVISVKLWSLGELWPLPWRLEKQYLADGWWSALSKELRGLMCFIFLDELKPFLSCSASLAKRRSRS